MKETSKPRNILGYLEEEVEMILCVARPNLNQQLGGQVNRDMELEFTNSPTQSTNTSRFVHAVLFALRPEVPAITQLS